MAIHNIGGSNKSHSLSGDRATISQKGNISYLPTSNVSYRYDASNGKRISLFVDPGSGGGGGGGGGGTTRPTSGLLYPRRTS